jgi:hypothetical protein
MRVISKLAQIDFQFGNITREGNLLVIESDPQAKMPATVYLSPGDITKLFKRIFVSPQALVFVLALPYFMVRWKTRSHAASMKSRRRREWPKV